MRALIGRTVTGLGGLMMLAACGGGGTTGTNYAEAPPVAEIVATPAPRATATPTEPEASPAATAEENMTTVNAN